MVWLERGPEFIPNTCMYAFTLRPMTLQSHTAHLDDRPGTARSTAAGSPLPPRESWRTRAGPWLLVVRAPAPRFDWAHPQADMGSSRHPQASDRTQRSAPKGHRHAAAPSGVDDPPPPQAAGRRRPMRKTPVEGQQRPGPGWKRGWGPRPDRWCQANTRGSELTVSGPTQTRGSDPKRSATPATGSRAQPSAHAASPNQRATPLWLGARWPSEKGAAGRKKPCDLGSGGSVGGVVWSPQQGVEGQARGQGGAGMREDGYN